MLATPQRLGQGEPIMVMLCIILQFEDLQPICIYGAASKYFSVYFYEKKKKKKKKKRACPSRPGYGKGNWPGWQWDRGIQCIQVYDLPQPYSGLWLWPFKGLERFVLPQSMFPVCLYMPVFLRIRINIACPLILSSTASKEGRH